jgi:thiamine kinase-like enzyme
MTRGFMDFEYLHLGGKRFISLNQNPFYFLWLLIWNKSLLKFGVGEKVLVRLIKVRFSPKKKRKVLRLPVNGTWCWSVRGGYKVFDMAHKSVIKVYEPEAEKEIIKKEVSLLSKIGQQEIAPSLKKWNIDEGWYEEEFIRGLSGNELIPKESPEVVMDRYLSFIEPNLEKIILSGSPKPLSSLRYLESLEDSLGTGRDSTNDPEVLKAHSFIHETASRCKGLLGQRDGQIYLTFCHGDFHQFNMFWTGSALKLIDWEAAQRLSLLFDFFNFFLSQVYLENTSLDWPTEVHKGLERMRSLLSENDPHLGESIRDNANLYRLIYYIERIHTFLNPFGLDSRKISRWIKAFEKFEMNKVN